jgi:cysteine-rich repeat protein
MSLRLYLAFVVAGLCGCPGGGGGGANDAGPTARCGNGAVDDGEACDDGNKVDNDACTKACANAACGDGILRSDLGQGQLGFEACDDDNLEDDDACTNACLIAACGDGIARSDLSEGEEGFETCDDGNTEDADACTNTCTPRCADHSDCPLVNQLCDGRLGAYGNCTDVVGATCQSDNDCKWTARDRTRYNLECVNNTCRGTQTQACTNNDQCGSDTTCQALGDRRFCLQSCANDNECSLMQMGCYEPGQQNGGFCWHSFCGAGNELSQRFNDVNNGTLHRGCEATHDGDGTPSNGSCFEVEAGGQDWVGLCFHGGGVDMGQVCNPEAERSSNDAYCQPGLICLPALSGDHRCRQLCSLPGSHGQARACPRGETCTESVLSRDTGLCIPAAQLCRIDDRAVCEDDTRCLVTNLTSGDGVCAHVENLVERDAACSEDANCPDGQYCYDRTRCRNYCHNGCAQGESCFRVDNNDAAGFCIPAP